MAADDLGGPGRVGHSDGAPARRAAGALEAEVLGVLWRATAPMSPGEVQQRLAEAAAGSPSLTYSTVVTIMSRLYAKGVLRRERAGRAYLYAPVADEAGLAARRMRRMLDTETDRDTVLTRFVSDLSERDEQLLRRLLYADSKPSPPLNGPSTALAAARVDGRTERGPDRCASSCICPY